MGYLRDQAEIRQAGRALSLRKSEGSDSKSGKHRTESRQCRKKSWSGGGPQGFDPFTPCLKRSKPQVGGWKKRPRHSKLSQEKKLTILKGQDWKKPWSSGGQHHSKQ